MGEKERERNKEGENGSTREIEEWSEGRIGRCVRDRERGKGQRKSCERVEEVV